MGGIRPTFKMQTISEYVKEFALDKTEKQILVMHKLGDEFVSKARNKRTYKDRTGNLRSSIGYVVAADGKVTKSSFLGEKANGVSAAKDFSDEILSGYPNGIVLIGVAGMNYAAYVESKNYDVISGSVPSEQRVKKFLDEIK